MTINMKKLMERLDAVDEAVTDAKMERDAAINTLIDSIIDEAKNISRTRPDCSRKEFEGMVSYVLKAVQVNLRSRTLIWGNVAADNGEYGEELKRRR